MVMQKWKLVNAENVHPDTPRTIRAPCKTTTVKKNGVYTTRVVKRLLIKDRQGLKVYVPIEDDEK